jgi:hypothetical protein
LSVHQDGGGPIIGTSEILCKEASTSEIKWHPITNKYPETAYVLKQAHKILIDIVTDLINAFLGNVSVNTATSQRKKNSVFRVVLIHAATVAKQR